MFSLFRRTIYSVDLTCAFLRQRCSIVMRLLLNNYSWLLPIPSLNHSYKPKYLALLYKDYGWSQRQLQLHYTLLHKRFLLSLGKLISKTTYITLSLCRCTIVTLYPITFWYHKTQDLVGAPAPSFTLYRVLWYILKHNGNASCKIILKLTSGKMNIIKSW